METLSSIQTVRSRARQWRRDSEVVALVPTMGNLHAGHLRLVEVAKAHGTKVVVSIFVNPLQFGENEDFTSYPRTIEADLGKLVQFPVDALFLPDVSAIYPRPVEEMTRVSVPGLSDILCGASRPGHFAGVATVVNLLFNVVQPDVALFGEKDYQQLLVIRRMVADLQLPVEVLGVPTVREPNGLALSSRNNYLSESERDKAGGLYQVLGEARDMIYKYTNDYSTIERASRGQLEAAGFRPDYVAIRRAADLRIPAPEDTDLVIMAAAWLGRTRLIDNLRVSLKRHG